MSRLRSASFGLLAGFMALYTTSSMFLRCYMCTMQVKATMSRLEAHLFRVLRKSCPHLSFWDLVTH